MKICIINVGIGQWYPKGAERLKNSLIEVGFSGSIKQWIDVWPNENYNIANKYNVKASALEEIINDYDLALWLDCSVWAIKNIQPIFDKIEKDGYYLIDNGFNLAQTVSDDCLNYYNITRNEAEKMTEVASGIFGLNIRSVEGKMLAEQFIQGCKDGASNGSRLHDNQSKDPRFLFHRQDQSVLSMSMNLIGLKPNGYWGEFVSYDVDKKESDEPIFLLRGF